jgi:hypothetical protein
MSLAGCKLLYVVAYVRCQYDFGTFLDFVRYDAVKGKNMLNFLAGILCLVSIGDSYNPPRLLTFAAKLELKQLAFKHFPHKCGTRVRQPF